jgi:3-isopropylmalate/(R)-2-methylmalate dehydratase small subunit
MSHMLRGKAWTFGRDIDTDLIIPARYLNMKTADELGPFCMIDADPDFSKKLNPGDIVVARENFGCGSSREHAPIALKGAGVSVVIAKSFARIFYRNAFNTGLPILVAPDAVDGIAEGDELTVDLATGEIKDLSCRAAATVHARTGGGGRSAPLPERASRSQLRRQRNPTRKEPK